MTDHQDDGQQQHAEEDPLLGGTSGGTGSKGAAGTGDIEFVSATQQARNGGRNKGRKEQSGHSMQAMARREMAYESAEHDDDDGDDVDSLQSDESRGSSSSHSVECSKLPTYILRIL